MMAGKNYEIKTTLAIDGEKQFKQALEDASRSMRVMDSEMKKAEAAYKAGGDGAEYFASKSRILKNEVAQQDAVVEALRNAVEEAAEKYGYASKQVQDYKIKLNQAETALIKMKKASQDADKAAEELGRDAEKVGDQIRDGLGDGAEDAAQKMDSSFDRIKNKIDEIRNHAAVQTAITVGRFVVDTVSNVMGFVEENTELTRQMAIAEFNMERYGFQWDQVDDLVVRAASITGDREGAIAAVSSLVQYGFDDISMLEAAMDALLGGIITRPGMSLETLAEDVLNTINTREATGAYAELVTEVLGLATAEEVNAALANAETAAHAAEIAMSYLTLGDLQTFTSEFIEQEQELVAYQQAAHDLAMAWNELSAAIMPIVTGLIDILAPVIDTLAGWINNTTLAETTREASESGAGAGNALITGAQEQMWELYPGTREAVEQAYAEGGNAWNAMWAMIEQVGENTAQRWSDRWDTISGWFVGEAGAEEMPIGWEEYAANAREQFETELANGQGAHNAGVEMVNQFGQGIEDGTAGPIAAVQNMVNQINSLLGGVGGGAYGLGFAGMGGVSLVVDGQELGRAVAGGVSSTLGRRVATRMYAD